MHMMFAPITEEQRNADMDRLKQAVRDTSASRVLDTYERMMLTNSGGDDLDTLLHALIVAVGETNEKLGGHCIVGKRDVFALL
jgi:hypothetical protein